MKYTVAYYTRTYTCQRIAEKIAGELSCDLIQVTDDIDWYGLLGFIKAGAYSAQDRQVDIQVNGNIDHADKIVFVAPMWAGGLAPAARAFLKTVPREKIHLVVSSLGNIVKDRSGYLSVSDITRAAKNEEHIIETLVKKLKENN